MPSPSPSGGASPERYSGHPPTSVWLSMMPGTLDLPPLNCARRALTSSMIRVSTGSRFGSVAPQSARTLS